MNTGMMELSLDQMNAASGELSTVYCVGKVLSGAYKGMMYGGLGGCIVGCMVGGAPGMGIGLAAGVAVGSIAGAIYAGATIEDK